MDYNAKASFIYLLPSIVPEFYISSEHKNAYRMI